MPVDGSPSTSFTSSVAWEVLVHACRATGLPAEGAELVRLGENAIFRLRGKPLVVRIGRSRERLPIIERELCVARWLDGAGVAVARAYDGVAQPVIADGYPVSVWHVIEDGRRRPGVEDLALVLRRLHALKHSPCDLPPLDPLTATARRVAAAAVLDQADRAFLLQRCRQVDARFRQLRFVLPCGFVHGDAHTGNLMGEPGRAVLIDLEAAATGPREWDLVSVAMARARFGLPEHAYIRFVELYGFDVTGWDGYGVLRDMRELFVTGWLIQNLAEGAAVAAEVALRIESIRDGDTNRGWHAF